MSVVLAWCWLLPPVPILGRQPPCPRSPYSHYVLHFVADIAGGVVSRLPPQQVIRHLRVIAYGPGFRQHLTCRTDGIRRGCPEGSRPGPPRPWVSTQPPKCCRLRPRQGFAHFCPTLQHLLIPPLSLPLLQPRAPRGFPRPREEPPDRCPPARSLFGFSLPVLLIYWLEKKIDFFTPPA